MSKPPAPTKPVQQEEETLPVLPPPEPPAQ